LQAGGAESDEPARKALAAFCEAYWAPLYTFVRSRGYSSADAQDIVQGFFEHLFQHNTLNRADKEKGRLRTFLLGSLRRLGLAPARHSGRTGCRRRRFGDPMLVFNISIFNSANSRECIFNSLPQRENVWL
jgi:DNA-directed RNA polymerase specialized sigma24 family protein